MGKLEELRDISLSVRNQGGYHRCTICNTVSNENIETEIGDYRPNTSFVHDPKDPMHFICISCNEVIDEQRRDYQEYDEWNELF